MAIVALLSSCSPKPRLLMPADGIETSQNMPTLAWKGVECDYYEVIVNDIVVEKVPGYKSASTAFPLSYGENTWQVRAIKGSSSKESEKRVIRVSDGTLSPLPQHSQLLREGWLLQSSAVAGKQLPESSEGWYRTSIPATVLTALVRNGVYPNPYVGMNNMQIPDSDDEYNEEYNLLKFSHIPGVNPWKDPYWFKTSFTLSEEIRDSKHIELNFREINYRADIYLNGQLLADREQAVGMERHLQYDVTDIVKRDSENTLAVLIYPVDNPGKPEVEPLTALANPGQNMGDGMISHDYAKWDTMGWDWIPAIRDRDMGITEEVFLAGDEGLVMDNVYVSAEPDLAQSGKAAVAISLDLKNFSDSEKAGELKLSIKGHGTDITLSKPYRVAAGSCQSVTLDASEFAEMEFTDAKLWWPVGYGEPNLYEYSLTADADIQSGHFGIRKVESRMGASAREFFINGRRIYPVGGNWVIDMMLNWTPSRYEKEILLTKNAGLNMLRVWGPTGIAPDALFDAADRHGILMWQDFLNDFWGTFRNRPGYQPELALYREISTGIVKRLRNHPSLIIWCGGNEGVNPREEMLVNEILAIEDSRTSRFYLSASDGDGLHGGGPYNTIQPEEYFTHQKLSGFSSEIGPSGLPVWQSADKFLLDQEGAAAVGRFPLDGQFAYHDANDWPGQDKRKFHTYDDMVRGWYGSIDSTDFRKACRDYFAKAQFVNYDVYKAAVESINRQLWDGACGIMLWKSNSAWPSMVWQLYDWYLQANSGYYATKKAAEPLHVQLNRDDHSVSVINLTSQAVSSLKVNATLYDFQANAVWTEEADLDSAIDGATLTGICVPKKAETGILRLTLLSSEGEEISHNDYWIGSDHDYASLVNLKPSISVSVVSETIENGKRCYEIIVQNKGKDISPLTQLSLQGRKSHQEILPSLWSDNFLTLLPGEQRTLTLQVFEEDITEPVEITINSFLK